MESPSRESSGQGSGGGADRPATGPGEPALTVNGWAEVPHKVRRRPFPGPSGSTERLRVTIARQAYADLAAHAKESLNAEICGVLVGDLCEDDQGRYVSVEGTIRGTSAKTGSTHVTFTQETWTLIHRAKDAQYPKRQIVGWYHTHPGFGVEFSEMDLFIQRNFFSGAGQIAFVADPLGGQEAILVNVDGQTVPVSRFWVEGREKRCHGATGAAAEAGDQGNRTSPAATDAAIRSLENRVGQLMELVDSQNASLHRYILTLGMVVALAICTYIGYGIFRAYTADSRPPELQSFVPVPVQVGDRSVMLGVAVVKWDVPPSLNAAFVQVERERQAAAAAASAKTTAATTRTTAPASAPTTTPASAPTTVPALR